LKGGALNPKKSVRKMRNRKIVGLFCMVMAVAIVAPTLSEFISATAAKDKVVVNIRLPETLNTLNRLSTRSVYEQYYVMILIHDSLTNSKPYSFETQPWMAESIALDTPSLTCKVRLKDNIVWHDGKPVTVEDVKFSYDLYIWLSALGTGPSAAETDCLKSVDIMDDHTLLFRLKKPYAPFLRYTLGVSILPKHIWQPRWDEVREKAKEPREQANMLMDMPDDKPIGCGPFRVVKWIKREGVILEANDAYFAGKPKVDLVNLPIVVESDAALMRFEAGKLDMVAGLLPAQVEELKGKPNIAIVKSNRTGYGCFTINCEKPPLDDPCFRRAINYVTDRDFIVNRAWEGHALPAYSTRPLTGATAYDYWHNPDCPTYSKGMSRKQAVALAKKELAKGGYTWDKEGRLVSPEGKLVRTIEVMSVTPEAAVTSAMIAQQMTKWVGEIGISAKFKPSAWSIISDSLDHGKYDICMMGFSTHPDPDDERTFYGSQFAVEYGSNYIRYRNQKVDKLLEAQAREMDPKARQKLVFEIQRTVMEDSAVIPLYRQFIYDTYKSDRFTGWTIGAGGIDGASGYNMFWSLLSIKPVK
jgi:peptide/nickel transport system substrate-binding protein